MGNFEKLSVLVIGVIIVMILVVALYTWTDNPAEPEAGTPSASGLTSPTGEGLGGDRLGGGDLRGSTPNGDALGGGTGNGGEPGGGWLAWTEDSEGEESRETDIVPRRESDLMAGTEPVAGERRGNETPAAPAETAERTYTVKPGQTLSHISLEVYGTVKHWPKIAERNAVDPNRLPPGTVLIIPAIAAATPSADNKPAVASATGAGPRAGADYVVRNGDTIQKISQTVFGTIERWDDIWISNLERVEDPRFLRVGMTLRIPN